MKTTEKHSNLFFMLTSSAHSHAQQERLQHYQNAGIKITPFPFMSAHFDKIMTCTQPIKGIFFCPPQIIDDWIYSCYSLQGVHIGLHFKENIFNKSFLLLDPLCSIVTIWILGLDYKDWFICFVGDPIFNSLYSLPSIHFSIMAKNYVY